MPFTGSHPAAVLPFLRTGLPASALVIGSMAPDVPYYLPVDLGERTHAPVDVVSTDLLIGALVWLLWHGVLSRPLVDTAPAALRARLVGQVQLGVGVRLSVRSVVGVLAALVVGAATHVLWDSFTHAGSWGPAHLAVLSRDWAGRPGYDRAQDLRGVRGAGVLLVWAVRWWRRTPPRPRPAGPVVPVGWVAVLVAGIIGGTVAALTRPDLRSAAVVAAFTGGGCAGLTAVVLAAGWWVRRWAADDVRRI